METQGSNYYLFFTAYSPQLIQSDKTADQNWLQAFCCLQQIGKRPLSHSWLALALITSKHYLFVALGNFSDCVVKEALLLV